MEVFVPTVLAVVAVLLVGRWVNRPVKELRRDLSVATRTHEELGSRTQAAELEIARLLSLFEAISEGMVQIRPDTRLVHANAAARTLLGLPNNSDGQMVAALVRNIELRELMLNAARGETAEPHELVLDSRQLLVTPKALPLVGGQSPGAVITVVDLTELRRLESVRRDFVANVSHELKTPLTSIRGYTETLLSEDLPAEMRQQFLEVVHNNATRIQRIVDDLLDLSRLQSGGWQPEPQEVDAGALAREVWASCERQAEDKNISFAMTGAHLLVIADAGGLRQVLTNLFDNAIRYTPDGGSVQVSIAPVRPRSNGKAVSTVELVVTDNGVGIPRDSLPRIFERFYRVDPARSRAEGGTGLGLAIVKHLVERMAGDVKADSELGKGTTIRVRLPAAPSHD